MNILSPQRKKIYCLTCDKEVDYEIKISAEKRNIKGTEVEINAKHAYCKECGSYLFVYELEKENQIKVFDLYKKAQGLLTSAEIIAIREKYHLSQTKLAKCIKCGEKNIARYENGALQENSIDLLIRILDKAPQLFGITIKEEKIKENDSILLSTPYFVAEDYRYTSNESTSYSFKKGGKQLCPTA